jgi:hypothetical protein
LAADQTITLRLGRIRLIANSPENRYNLWRCAVLEWLEVGRQLRDFGDPSHAFGYRPARSDMSSATPLVFVIDDDPSVRKSVARLLRSAKHDSETFESASDFLARPAHSGPACVIVDVQMPGLNGLAFQEALLQRRCFRFSGETLQA